MICQAGIPVNVTAIFTGPTPTNVAFSVYDDTGTLPSLVDSPIVMAQVAGNAYRAKFTPLPGKLYVIFMAAYTDGTFTSLDPTYAAIQQAVAIAPLPLMPPVQAVVGIVECNPAQGS